jgi:tetratricopeptide (TPR) repeat protein
MKKIIFLFLINFSFLNIYSQTIGEPQTVDWEELNNDEIIKYSKIIGDEPNDGNAFVNRGNAKVQLGDFKGAMADYNQALYIDPNDVYAYNNRVDMQIKPAVLVKQHF